MASATERALGRVLGKHRTHNEARRKVAWRALGVGLLCVLAVLVMAVAGIPLLILLPLLAIGFFCLWQATRLVRDARRLGDDVFTIRERGLTYRRTGGTTTAVPWRDMLSVTVRGRDRFLWRWFGHDIRCRVELTIGALRVTGFTEDAYELVDTIATYAGEQRIPRAHQWEDEDEESEAREARKKPAKRKEKAIEDDDEWVWEDEEPQAPASGEKAGERSREKSVEAGKRQDQDDDGWTWEDGEPGDGEPGAQVSGEQPRTSETLDEDDGWTWEEEPEAPAADEARTSREPAPGKAGKHQKRRVESANVTEDEDEWVFEDEESGAREKHGSSDRSFSETG